MSPDAEPVDFGIAASAVADTAAIFAVFVTCVADSAAMFVVFVAAVADTDAMLVVFVVAVEDTDVMLASLLNTPLSMFCNLAAVIGVVVTG